MRNKTYTLVILISMVTSAMLAQTPQRNCGTMHNLEYLKTQDAGLENRMNLIEQQTASFIQKNSTLQTAGTDRKSVV